MGTEQTGRGGVGSRKHGKSGKPGHNRDMVQTSRELNEELAEQSRVKATRQGEMAKSVRDLMKDA